MTAHHKTFLYTSRLRFVCPGGTLRLGRTVRSSNFVEEIRSRVVSFRVGGDKGMFGAFARLVWRRTVESLRRCLDRVSTRLLKLN